MSKYKSSVKRSISLSETVSRWADELAEKRGFGTNFSAFVADLVRREKERQENLQGKIVAGVPGERRQPTSPLSFNEP